MFIQKLFILPVLLFGMLSAPVYAGGGKPTETQATAQQGEWEFVLELYGWSGISETNQRLTICR